MTRNPNATCATCPYWHRGWPGEDFEHEGAKILAGNCWRWGVNGYFIPSNRWCGEHPDILNREPSSVAADHRRLMIPWRPWA